MNTFGLGRKVNTFGLGLPYAGDIPVEPPVIPPEKPGDVGTGARTYGGYRPNYQDEIDDVLRKRILREDEEISELIVAIVTKGLI